MNTSHKFSPSLAAGILLWIFSLSLHSYYFFHNRTFGQDQARDVMIAEANIAEGRWLIGYGPKASVGDFYLPPLYYYLQTGLYAIVSWPLAMGLLITIVESFTPVLLWYLLSKRVHPTAGVVAGLLYTISPVVVTFATFMWNPNMIPFFLTLALL